ncbi:HXXEE domain-containing protein [Weissella paramesenteroides]|uniref:HXXEE domain-containing protein n=1 Tax=Weissella paramesenteroides TaxID=1249 RepID=UPI003F747E32
MQKFIQRLLLSHFYVDIILFIFSSCLLLIQWDSLSIDHRLAYGLYITMCLHQLEEYRFPGGFVWGFNKMLFNSDQPDRYPGNRLSAVFVDIFAMFLAGPFLYWHYTPAMAMCFALFAIIEVLGHFMFGILALRRYHTQGKETIYFPGSFTSWIFFAPLSIVLIHELVSTSLMVANQWWWAIGCLIAYFIIGFAWPTFGFINRDTPYIYDEEPREGFYFKKFTNEK